LAELLSAKNFCATRDTTFLNGMPLSKLRQHFLLNVPLGGK
jgi:hypothetical protein